MGTLERVPGRKVGRRMAKVVVGATAALPFAASGAAASPACACGGGAPPEPTPDPSSLPATPDAAEAWLEDAETTPPPRQPDPPPVAAAPPPPDPEPVVRPVRDPEAPLGATVPPPPDPEPVVRPLRDPEAPVGATVPTTTAPPDDGPPTGTTSTTTTVPPAPETEVSEESTPDEPATTLEPADLPPAPPDSVRVATWNLGQGKAFTNAGGTDRHQIDSVAEDLHQSGADVVMVQEVFREDAHVLADELQGRAPEGTEVHINFSHAGDKRRFDERNPVESVFDWIAGEEFGNAIITYAPQTEFIDERLPSDGDEGRSVVGSSTEVREEELRVFTTHISSQEPREEFGPPTGTTTPGTTIPPAPEIHDPQSAQIWRVLEEADGSGPMILGGDFNVTLGSSRPSAAVINGYDERGFTDAGAGAGATSSCGEGNRIDYVFTEDVEVLGSYVMSCGPSDHAAVVVDVRVP